MLRTLREKKNLTQQQVADIMSISRQAYSKWEIGEREPDYAMLVKLADFYTVTIDYLLGRPSAAISFASEDKVDPVDKVRVAMEQALNRPIDRADAEAMLDAFERLTKPR